MKLFGLFDDEMRYVTVLGSDESFGNVGIMGIGVNVVVALVVLIGHAGPMRCGFVVVGVVTARHCGTFSLRRLIAHQRDLVTELGRCRIFGAVVANTKQVTSLQNGVINQFPSQSTT